MQASIQQQQLIIDLQQIDNQILQAQTKLKALPEIEQLLHIDKRVVDAKAQLSLVNAEADQIKLELRRSEVDVETVTDRIKKDEARLNSPSTSPKELEQLQHEILTLKKRQESLEEIEIEIMIRNDEITLRQESLATDLASLQVLKDEINQRLTTAQSEINLSIATKNNQRGVIVGQIEKPLADLYEKIRQASGGVGAALLIGDKCTGCNLAINAVEMARIKALAADEVIRCEECRRILVRS